MEFSIVRSAQASRGYQNQDRIAELNQKSPVRSLQGQVDRVSISGAARRLAEENPDSRTGGPTTRPTGN